MRLVLTSAIGASALALSACGSESSGTITTEDGETVEYSVDGDDSDSATMRITGPDGEEVVSRTGPGVDVNLPDGISMYPGAKVVSNTVVSGGTEGSGSMIMFESEDSPEAITGFYRKQAEDAGITIQIDAKMNDAQMIAGEKESDNSSFMVTASREETGVTNAQMMVTVKPDG
ncbi:MAG: hypothetical protein QNJ15_08505 [Erythrobacter sp.]|nr:hypothetical protein [Erythrobacter sp.]